MRSKEHRPIVARAIIAILVAAVLAASGCQQATDPPAPDPSAKELTGFAFLRADNSSNKHDFIAVIDQAAHTARVDVGYNVDLSALVPRVTLSGSSVQPASGVAQAFAEGTPVAYTVTARDGSAQDYAVTVNVLPMASLSGTITLPAADPDAPGMETRATLEGESPIAGKPRPINLTWASDNASATFSLADVEEDAYTISVQLVDDAGPDYVGTIEHYAVSYSGAHTVTVPLISTGTTSISGTVTLPAGAEGKSMTVTASSMSVNASVNLTCEAGSSQGYTIPDIDGGTYYVDVLIDMDDSGVMPSNGDYQGYYGGSGINPPEDANVASSAGAPATGIDIAPVRFDAGSMHGTLTIPEALGVSRQLLVIVAPNLTVGYFGYGAYWPAGTAQEAYSIGTLKAGTYFVKLWVDVNGSGTSDSGDYLGYYGGTGAAPPSSPNVTITAGADLLIDITAAQIP